MLFSRPANGDAKVRSSNLELYRIICMLMIVAHHFVVSSGLSSEVLPFNARSANSIFLYLFGMFGKTGINCFLMITGYFMCRSRITLRKFLKLMLEIYFYNIVIYAVFLTMGRETVSILGIARILMPVWGFDTNFTSCFIGFYLTIPFLNILVHNMNKRQHQMLLLVLLGMYTILGSIPAFYIALNYVTWFGIIYFISSYISLYPEKLFENGKLWGAVTVLLVIASAASVVFMIFHGKNPYYFLIESNRILAVAVAVSSFLWIKNLNIPQSGFINALGGSTFGVLLIHTSSDAMRQWLWRDVVDCVGHYSLPTGKLVLYSTGVVIAIFIVCVIIDRLRIKFIEKPLLACIFPQSVATENVGKSASAAGEESPGD